MITEKEQIEDKTNQCWAAQSAIITTISAVTAVLQKLQKYLLICFRKWWLI